MSVDRKSFWEILNSLATLLTAIAAVVSLYIAQVTLKKTNEIQESEIASKAPILKISDAKIESRFGGNSDFTCKIQVENIGQRPAEAFKGTMLLIKQGTEPPTMAKSDLESANPLFPGHQWLWMPDPPMDPELPPMIIIIIASYDDGPLRKRIQQKFFMKWKGRTAEIFKTSLDNMELKEKLYWEKRLGI